jgi:hypothetical protein
MLANGRAAPARELRRGAWRSGWLVLAFIASLPAVTTRIYASDEIQYFSYLRSLYFDRDVSFENEYRHFYDAGISRSPGFHETHLERTTEAGRRINFATIGCAIMWAPFYAVGDLAARWLHARGGTVAVDGYSWPYVAAVAYASAFYGFLALIVSMACVRRLGGPRSSMAAYDAPAAWAVWLGTPLLFYMYVAPPMSHATSAFTVSAFVLAWLIVRVRWSAPGMITLGVLAALVAMVREQDAFFVVGPALDFGVHLWRTRDRAERTRLVLAAAAGAAAAAIAYLPQALAYLALNGHIGPSRLVGRKMTWTAPHALEVLWSPTHGFFFWTPLAVLGLAGLAWLPRGAAAAPAPRLVTISLAAIAAAQVYIAGSVESWTVAGAFGQRRFIPLTPLLVIGLAALLGALRPVGRRTLAAALVLATWWNIGLVVQFGAGMMNRQRLEPAAIAYRTFVVLPARLPDLAWRYIFDRESFYERNRQLREGR